MTRDGRSVVSSPLTKNERLAALAAVLARAAIGGEVVATDALRVIKHELRTRNTNKALLAPYRSRGAQEVLDRYAAAGERVPNNNSQDALHCDHVHPLNERDLEGLTTPGAWLERLRELDIVVCVTAAENYALEKVERTGEHGWEKYPEAGVEVFQVAP